MPERAAKHSIAPQAQRSGHSLPRQLPSSIRRFVAEEEGLESVEWLTLAILMGSIVLYIGRDLLTLIFDAFLEAFVPVGPN